MYKAYTDFITTIMSYYVKLCLTYLQGFDEIVPGLVPGVPLAHPALPLYPGLGSNPRHLVHR
jgi:hypothetical protein